MNPRFIAALKIIVLFVVILLIVLLFPKAQEFVEMAALDLRYLWWVVLLIVLAAWLIWGMGKKKK